MAESTRDIKRRIRGVTSTTKITRAMELVSTSKLRRARIRLEESRPYYTTVLENIRNVLADAGNVKHPLLDNREVKSTLYIVLASDRGLAGGYNSNVIRLAENDIKERGLDAKVITVGSKSRDYFTRREYNVVGKFVGISEEPSFADARKIGEIALDLYKNNEIDEINVVYSHFVSTLTQQPRILKLLPSKEVHEESKSL